MKKMEEIYRLRDEGPVDCFLNVQFETNGDELKMTQEHYIESMLKRFGMEECNAVKIPMSPNADMKVEGDKVDETMHRAVIGSLMYLMVCTRPDLAFVLSALSRHLKDPRKKHMQAAKRVLRYLKGTKSMSLKMKLKNGFDLIGFSDASHGDCKDSGYKSTMGHLVFMGKALVMWKSKMQSFVAKSTFEAEFGALSTLITELVWVKAVMNEIVSKKGDAPLVMVDNRGAVQTANNNKMTHRNKTVAIRYHHVLDQTEKKLVKIKHVRTEKNIADALTKALGVSKFSGFVKWLMGHDQEKWKEVIDLIESLD